MSEYTKQLEAMDEVWAEASEGPAFVSIPPGSYTCRLMSAELGKNANEGLQVVVQYLICEGEHANQTITDWQQLDASEVSPRFFRGFVETMGFEFPSKPSGVEELCAQMSQAKPGCIVRVSKQKNSDYNRIRVTQRVPDSELPDIVEEDEIPYESTGTAKTAGTTESADAPDGAQSDHRADMDAFCLSTEIDVNDSMSDEEVAKEICAYDYPDLSQLTPQECTLLVGLGAIIDARAPDETPKKKAPKKKTAEPRRDWDGDLKKIAKHTGLTIGRRPVPDLVNEMIGEYDWSEVDDEDDLVVLKHFNIVK